MKWNLVVNWILRFIQKYIETREALAKKLEEDLSAVEKRNQRILELDERNAEIFKKRHETALADQRKILAKTDEVLITNIHLKEQYEELVAQRQKNLEKIKSLDPDSVLHFDLGIQPRDKSG